MGWATLSAWTASADTRIAPDPTPAPVVQPAPARFPLSSDLDGFYLWLGPTGAASHVEGDWDTTFGGELAITRVREHASLGVAGTSLGAALWTERGGGRIWLDAVVGTRVLGVMTGLTAGPIVELSELQHTRVGGSIGAWAFAGITPFARVGAVDELGMFAEVGVHVVLPVVRH